jgi:fructose-1,6-bisphosphatase/inositol monophosphatase family enzyme
MSAAAQLLLEAAAEVARLAGETALRHFKAGLAVERKRDGSPVTAADREAERAARAWIEQRFPEDGIVGEELGETRPEARRRWYIDPVDGTASFIRGVPLWGSLVGVTERVEGDGAGGAPGERAVAGAEAEARSGARAARIAGAESQARSGARGAPGERVIAGAASFPALAEEIAAARGLGSWWNGRRCAVSAVASLESATVLTTDERFAGDRAQREGWERLAARAGFSRSWGDCYGYLLVATGRAELMCDGRVHSWDAAPFVVILEEAGGVFTDWAGGATPFGGNAIATNAALAGTLRRLLAGLPLPAHQGAEP